MTEHAAVEGEFVTYSHIKTRKTFTITIEFPEEQALHILNILGAPVGQVSKPVAVCLLNEQPFATSNLSKEELSKPNPPPMTHGTSKEKSEGDKLRERACILCGEGSFHKWIGLTSNAGTKKGEVIARANILAQCNISSRSDLTSNERAQELFKYMDRDYREWLKPSIDEQYPDNLAR